MFIGYDYLQPLIVVVLQHSWLAENLGRLVSALIVLVLLLAKPCRQELLRHQRAFLFLLSALTVVSFSGLLSAFTTLGVAWQAAYNVATCWLVFMAFSVIGRDDRASRTILWCLAAFAAVNAGVGTWGALTGKAFLGVTPDTVGFGAFGFDAETGRSGGFRGENYVGVWNVPILAFGWFLVQERGAARKISGVGLLVLAVASVVVSLSRASVLCAAVAVLVLLLRRSGNQTVRRRLAVGSIVLVAAGLFADTIVHSEMDPMSAGAWRNVQTRFSAEGTLGDIRFEVWRIYLWRALQSPVWGLGPGAIGSISAELGAGLVPHNSEIDVFVEYGLLGLSIYLIALLAPGKKVWLYIIQGRCDPSGDGHLFAALFSGVFAALLTLSNPLLKIFWIISGLLAARPATQQRAHLAPTGKALQPGWRTRPGPRREPILEPWRSANQGRQVPFGPLSGGREARRVPPSVVVADWRR